MRTQLVKKGEQRLASVILFRVELKEHETMVKDHYYYIIGRKGFVPAGAKCCPPYISLNLFREGLFMGFMYDT
jgi:hypothetical protein